LKILFYIPSFSGGGAERNTVLIANDLVNRGIAVLCVVDRNIGPNKKLLDKKIIVITLMGEKKSHFFSLLEYIKIIKLEKPNVVFSRIGLCPLKSAISRIFIKYWWIVSYHNPYEPTKPIGGRLTYIFSSFIVKLANKAFVVSNDIKDELVRNFGANKLKLQVIPNPINIEMIDRLRNKQLNSKVAADLGNSKYLLAVGRLSFQKGFDVLIDAFDLIKDKYQGKLLIIGEGESRQKLQQKIDTYGLNGRILLMGYQENPFQFYNTADAFILSSRYEGFGNVLIEALHFGLKIISTDCPGGPRDILKSGKYGLLCKVNDPEDMANSILNALKNTCINTEKLIQYSTTFEVKNITNMYLDLAQCSHEEYLKT
jgi:glycosyltransferase involved in cell wall biosynthesis